MGGAAALWWRWRTVPGPLTRRVRQAGWHRAIPHVYWHYTTSTLQHTRKLTCCAQARAPSAGAPVARRPAKLQPLAFIIKNTESNTLADPRHPGCRGHWHTVAPAVCDGALPNKQARPAASQSWGSSNLPGTSRASTELSPQAPPTAHHLPPAGAAVSPATFFWRLIEDIRAAGTTAQLPPGPP